MSINHEDLDLDALEATARAVTTPGPWETRCEGYGEPTRVCHDSEYVVYLGYDYAADLGAEDADHIATFDPPTVLALIAHLREAEARVRGLGFALEGTQGALREAEACIDKAIAAHDAPGAMREASAMLEALATHKPTAENGEGMNQTTKHEGER